VGLNLTDFAVIAVLVAAGCGLSYLGLWLMLRQTASERQQAMESQLSVLTGALTALETRVAELNRPAAAAPGAEKDAAAEAAKPEAVHREEEQVTPETLVMIAAAVTAFLGKKVRIRSAKLLHSPHPVTNPWAQQGRALVHASHNPRSRG
jgi:small neutral amino acid transporter SnatA (MarC family)